MCMFSFLVTWKLTQILHRYLLLNLVGIVSTHCCSVDLGLGFAAQGATSRCITAFMLKGATTLQLLNSFWLQIFTPSSRTYEHVTDIRLLITDLFFLVILLLRSNSQIHIHTLCRYGIISRIYYKNIINFLLLSSLQP